MGRIYDIAIVGAGAAGLFAASYLTHSLSGATHKPSVIIIEKMPRPGRKLNITGKGRCNLTNARMWDEFSVHIHPNQSFLKSSFYNLSSSQTVDYFEKLGLPLTVERGQRVFPKSMRAMDVTDSLVNSIKRGGIVEFLTNSPVERINYSEQERRFSVQYLSSADSKPDTICAKRILLTTGGLSYPSTGSTGDGYTFAKELGHTITPLYPSLTALIPANYSKIFNTSHKPLTIKNVALSLKVDGNIVQEEFGDVDFTSGGLEGSLGFRVSRKGVIALSNNSKVQVVIDFKPSISLEKLSTRISTLASSSKELKGGEIKRVLKQLLPNEIINPFLTFLSISKSQSINMLQLSTTELAGYLKNYTLNIVGNVGYERAVVTSGGVSLKEISSRTMESKLVAGLYFAGELLDIDADTGGYNLQCAFSSAALAIESILKTLSV